MVRYFSVVLPEDKNGGFEQYSSFYLDDVSQKECLLYIHRIKWLTPNYNDVVLETNGMYYDCIRYLQPRKGVRKAVGND